MAEHRCQYELRAHYEDRSATPAKYNGHWIEFYEDYEGANCCGRVARFKLGDNIWLCAEHYDLWVKTYCNVGSVPNNVTGGDGFMYKE